MSPNGDLCQSEPPDRPQGNGDCGIIDDWNEDSAETEAHPNGDCQASPIHASTPYEGGHQGHYESGEQEKAGDSNLHGVGQIPDLARGYGRGPDLAKPGGLGACHSETEAKRPRS